MYYVNMHSAIVNIAEIQLVNISAILAEIYKLLKFQVPLSPICQNRQLTTTAANLHVTSVSGYNGPSQSLIF